MKKIVMTMIIGLMTTGLFAHGNDNDTDFLTGNEQDTSYSCVATYNFLTKTLHIPCVQVGQEIYWIDLELNTNNGTDNITLKLKGADINKNYKKYMNERNNMKGRGMDNMDDENFRDDNMRMNDNRGNMQYDNEMDNRDNMPYNNRMNNSRMRNYRR